MGQFPHVRVSGDAAQRGRQLGKQASERVARSVAIYREVFAHYAGWDWPRVVEHATLYRPAIAAYEPRYLEEIDAIAGGAGLDPGDVLALNVRTEIMFAAVARAAANECTAFAALPEATADGHTLIGQNWDWIPEMSDTVIVLEAEQDEGPNFVTVVEAGLLAKTGFNSAGIGLATNALVTDQDRGEPGVPYHVILRGILDSESLSDALGAVTRRPRASAANYLVTHRDGEAVDIEAAPGDYSRVYLTFPEDGLSAHTNHYIGDDFDLKDVALWRMTSSPFRLHRLGKSLRQHHGSLGPDRLQTILSDHFNYPNAICCHPDTRLEPMERNASVASVIMDLNSQTLWLADGNPCQTPYRELDYTSVLNKGVSVSPPA